MCSRPRLPVLTNVPTRAHGASGDTPRASDPSDDRPPAGSPPVPTAHPVVVRGPVSPSPAGVPVYGLDIETDTSTDGLDPTRSPVVAAAVATAAGTWVVDGPEDHLLRDLDDLLRALDPGVLVTWYGSGFDLPFLAERARRWGLRLGLRLWADPDVGSPAAPVHRASWHGHRHLDCHRAWRADLGGALGISCSLKSVARLCGLPVVEVDTTAIHRLTTGELRRYVASDASLARELALRRWPTLTGAADRAGADHPAARWWALRHTGGGGSPAPPPPGAGRAGPGVSG